MKKTYMKGTHMEETHRQPPQEDFYRRDKPGDTSRDRERQRDFYRERGMRAETTLYPRRLHLEEVPVRYT